MDAKNHGDVLVLSKQTDFGLLFKAAQNGEKFFSIYWTIAQRGKFHKEHELSPTSYVLMRDELALLAQAAKRIASLERRKNLQGNEENPEKILELSEIISNVFNVSVAYHAEPDDDSLASDNAQAWMALAEKLDFKPYLKLYSQHQQ